MSQNKSRAASLRHTLIVALFSIGTLFFFFPIADAGTGGYMTAVPMFCRLVLAAAVFPFLAGRAGQHMAQTGAWLYSSGGSKLERPGAVILGSIAGPICFVPAGCEPLCKPASRRRRTAGQPGVSGRSRGASCCRGLHRGRVQGAFAGGSGRDAGGPSLPGIAAFVVLLGSGAAAAPEARPNGQNVS